MGLDGKNPFRDHMGLALGGVSCMVPRPCAGFPGKSLVATALDDIPARPPPWTVFR